MSTEENRWYVAGTNGKPYGPYSFARLLEYVNSGRINQETLVLRQGDSSWCRAATIANLFSVAAEPPHAPVPSKGPNPPASSAKPAADTAGLKSGSIVPYAVVAVLLMLVSLVQCSGIAEHGRIGEEVRYMRVSDLFVAGASIFNTAILVLILGSLQSRSR